MEEWRDIEGYEGLYQVSNEGRVRSVDIEIDAYNFNAKRNIKYIKKGCILAGSPDKNGYLQVTLCRGSKDHKRCKVHRLVALAFIPNPDNLPEVNHKDECKENNFADNLEWCDRVRNVTWNDLHLRTGYKNRNNPLLSRRVMQLSVNGELIAIYDSTREAERNGFNHCDVSLCCNGKLKTHKGYRWQYE